MPAGQRRRTDRVRQVRTEAYRGAIRTAAERVIARYGFAGARVQQIAAEAGMSVGTVYRAYPGKKAEIYREIHLHNGTALLGRAQGAGTAAFQRTGDVLDSMLAGIGAYVAYFLEHPDFLRIVLRDEQAWTQRARKSTAQTVMWNDGMGGLEDGVRLGIATGIFVDEPPSVVARTLIAIQQAHLSCWLESDRHEPHGEVVARLHRQLVHAVCRPAIVAERLARLVSFRESSTYGRGNAP
jgi:AcrR family transcriptional regulator